MDATEATRTPALRMTSAVTRRRRIARADRVIDERPEAERDYPEKRGFERAGDQDRRDRRFARAAMLPEPPQEGGQPDGRAFSRVPSGPEPGHVGIKGEAEVYPRARVGRSYLGRDV